MIDTKWRPFCQTHLIEPWLKNLKLHPLWLTAFGCFFGLLIPLLLFFNFAYFALVSLLLSGLCDVLDGSLARHQNKTSPIGAALDITADRLVEFAIILGLFLIDPHKRGLPCLLMLGSVLLCITTFLVVGIFSKNKSEKGFHYSPGLMERTEAFMFFTLMMLFPSYFTPLAAIFFVLTFFTAGKRLHEFTI